MTVYRSIAGLSLAVGAFGLPAHAEEEPAAELDTVVVTAQPPKKPSDFAQPVLDLTADDLVSKAQPTIGATLQQELGMNSQSFGPNVGSPIIRGQAGPRVRVLQNGIGNHDVSTLSPDHANSVEPLLADRIEVLRGPSTLLYGSGAIGGVVNILDGRIPEAVPEKPFGGAFEQRYHSVNDETASVLKLEGGGGHIAMHLDGFYRDSGDTRIGGAAIDEDAARATDPSLEGVDPIQNSRGFIDNSNARAKGGSAGVSLAGESGYAGVSINHLDNQYGIPPDGGGGDPVRIDLQQNRYDFKSEWKKPFEYAEALRLKFNYTDYRHVELEGGVPGTVFTNDTYESRLELVHAPLGSWHGVVGFQSINGELDSIGEEALIPRSNLDTYALFAIETLSAGPVTYELGIRAEHQEIRAEGRKDNGHAPISGAASAQWRVDERNRLRLAITQSQRAPQVQELYSDGVHAATRSFDLGNPDLAKEVSYNLDFGYRFQESWISAEVDLFHNWVRDYIFQQRTGQVFNEADDRIENACTAPGECLPVLQYQQADAIFKGFEAKLMLPLMENRYGVVDLTLFGDYTRGEFVRGGDVPRMPPLRYGFQLDYQQSDWTANLRLTRGEPQNHPGGNESSTGGYLLLNLLVQYQIQAFEQAEVTLFAKGNNLLDENIRNATSYLRNFAPEPGRGAEVGLRVRY